MKHDRDIVWAEFSPDGSLLVTASLDKTARVWEAGTGKPVTEPLPHLDDLKHATFSPDSRFVATASSDNHARIWEARTGKLLAALRHARIVNRSRFSPDGRFVATSSFDRTARIWDAQNGQAVTPPMRHDEFVGDAVFSPDGARLLTSTARGSIRLWDVKTGRPLTEPLSWGKRIGVYLPHFTPDGRRVVMCEAGAGVAIWDLPPAPVPVPAWFPEFAENLAGLRISVQGNAELAPRTALSELAGTLKLIPGDDDYAAIARWLVDDPRTRGRSPFGSTLGSSIEPNPIPPAAESPESQKAR